MGEEKVDPRKELENLVEALEALLPPRNLISQLIMLLPLEYDRIKDMYPELVEDPDYWGMLCSALGLSPREREGRIVYEASYDSFSSRLRSIINSLFEFVRNDTNRALLSSVVGRIVPNYEREWLDSRLKALLKEKEISEPIKGVLRVLCEVDLASPEEIKEKTGLSDPEVERAVYALKEFKIIEETYDGKFRLEPHITHYRRYIAGVVG